MLNFNITSGATLARYVDIGKLPIGTYTATTRAVDTVTPTNVITTPTIKAVTLTSTIVVTHLVGTTTVVLGDVPDNTSNYIPGFYVGAIKFVDVADSEKVYITPLFSLTVSANPVP